MPDDKNRIMDIISAAKDEELATFFSSETFKDLLIDLLGKIVEEQTATLVGSIISLVAPRVHGFYLSYKQNRFERNITRLIKELTLRVDDLQINYAALSDDMREMYKTQFAEMLLDNVVEERQEEKIRWNVNGYINMMNNDSNENVMQIFFDTLTELTVLDVDTLKMHHYKGDITFSEYQEKYGIDYYQVRMVKEKLVRLGLLKRKNDEQRDKNIDEITEYLQKVEQESKKTKPRGVKLSNGVKKIGNTESYEITSLGSRFLIGIGEISG